MPDLLKMTASRTILEENENARTIVETRGAAVAPECDGCGQTAPGYCRSTAEFPDQTGAHLDVGKRRARRLRDRRGSLRQGLSRPGDLHLRCLGHRLGDPARRTR